MRKFQIFSLFLTTAKLEQATVPVQRVAGELHSLAHYRDVTPESKKITKLNRLN